MEGLISGIAGKPSLLTRDQIIMLRENNVGNREPAASMLGLEDLSFGAGLQRMFNP